MTNLLCFVDFFVMVSNQAGQHLACFQASCFSTHFHAWFFNSSISVYFYKAHWVWAYFFIILNPHKWFYRLLPKCDCSLNLRLHVYSPVAASKCFFLNPLSWSQSEGQSYSFGFQKIYQQWILPTFLWTSGNNALNL